MRKRMILYRLPGILCRLHGLKEGDRLHNWCPICALYCWYWSPIFADIMQKMKAKEN
jgi:hypothetical protein